MGEDPEPGTRRLGVITQEVCHVWTTKHVVCELFKNRTIKPELTVSGSAQSLKSKDVPVNEEHYGHGAGSEDRNWTEATQEAILIGWPHAREFDYHARQEKPCGYGKWVGVDCQND